MSLQILEKHIISRKDCWITNLNTNNNGYPFLEINGEMKGAHIVMFESYLGKIPDGMMVCHSCKNPACINPSHLFLGDKNQNKEESEQEHNEKIFARIKEIMGDAIPTKSQLKEFMLSASDADPDEIDEFIQEIGTISDCTFGTFSYKPITNNHYHAPVTNYNYNCPPDSFEDNC